MPERLREREDKILIPASTAQGGRRRRIIGLAYHFADFRAPYDRPFVYHP